MHRDVRLPFEIHQTDSRSGDGDVENYRPLELYVGLSYRLIKTFHSLSPWIFQALVYKCGAKDRDLESWRKTKIKIRSGCVVSSNRVLINADSHYVNSCREGGLQQPSPSGNVPQHTERSGGAVSLLQAVAAESCTLGSSSLQSSLQQPHKENFLTLAILILHVQ